MFNSKRNIDEEPTYTSAGKPYISNATIEELALAYVTKKENWDNISDPTDLARKFVIAYKKIQNEVSHLKNINFTDK